MTSVGWSLVESASQLLERDEREAVLGDLIEAGESAWRSLMDVLSLIIRRQALLWKNWQPWLAAFGLAFPGSLFLMGFSLSVSWTLKHLIDPPAPKVPLAIGLMPHSGIALLVCQLCLLIGWSWTGGFVVGSLSRRALWASIAASCLPCVFCFAKFHEASLPGFCLFLFLLPAIWGVRHGLKIARIKLSSAITIAAVITILTFLTSSKTGSWAILCASIWPTWYMVATARKPS
jgi:hypothetical protein